MTQLSHTSRRQRRRVGRYTVHRDLLTLDLTPEEILVELEPNWFQGAEAGTSGSAKQDRTDEAAA